MADKLPQSVEELLAAHKAMVAAMSPKQRIAYYNHITADQIEYARANPYTGGERQALAAAGVELISTGGTVGMLRAAIARAERVMAENAALRAERDQWRGTALNRLELMDSTALRVKDATIAHLTARVAELDAERERDHAEINVKADAIERMINQYAGDYARIAELRGALLQMIDAFDEHIAIPDEGCCCHISPPCNNCVTWSSAREAKRNARAALAKETGK